MSPQARGLENRYEYRPVDQAVNVASKQRIIDVMQEMVTAPPGELDEAVRSGYHAGAEVKVAHPIDALGDLDAVRERFCRPLRRALPDVERIVVSDTVHRTAQSALQRT